MTTNFAKAKRIIVGGSATCIIKMDNTLQCSGHQPNGHFGIRHTSGVQNPTDLSSFGVVKDVSMSGGSHLCAIDINNDVKCAGYNLHGELGNHSTTNSSVVVNTYFPKAKKVSTGLQHTCVITLDDDLVCVGNNMYGQFGRGNTTKSTVVTTLSNFGKVKNVTIVGGVAICAEGTDSIVRCAGANGYGELGKGSGGASHYPVVFAD